MIDSPKTVPLLQDQVKRIHLFTKANKDDGTIGTKKRAAISQRLAGPFPFTRLS